MKDTTTAHRKQSRSEGDLTKAQEHKDKHDHKEVHHKEPHHKTGAKGQPGPGHHAPPHGGRRISQYKRGRLDHEHDHDDDYHHSASSHPIRPRRDTMMSRYSTHHESDRRSVGTNELSTPMVFYENTYKLTPDTRFHEGKVREAILNVLKENITEKVYDPKVCGPKCQLLSEIIKERIKTLNMARFKIVCMVMIGQVNDQSMLITSRCLWDHRFDNSISVEYKQGDIIAVGLVFAVYAE